MGVSPPSVCLPLLAEYSGTVRRCSMQQLSFLVASASGQRAPGGIESGCSLGAGSFARIALERREQR
jgi:hypothetical protein